MFDQIYDYPTHRIPISCLIVSTNELEIIIEGSHRKKKPRRTNWKLIKYNKYLRILNKLHATFF